MTTSFQTRRLALRAGTAALLTSCALLAACEKSPPAESTPVFATPSNLQHAHVLASKTTGIDVGTLVAAQVVYVFFDPQCPHCATLWRASQPLLSKVRMRWVPVGVLGPRSVKQGAALLAATDRPGAMAQHEAQMAAGTGGISASAPAQAQERQMMTNTAVFKALGASSVPYLLFKNAKTGQYGEFSGSMSTEHLAALLGV